MIVCSPAETRKACKMYHELFVCGTLMVVVGMVCYTIVGRMWQEMPDPGKFKIVSVDFDGVIHSFKGGWCGDTVIEGYPLPGAIEWLGKLCDTGMSVCIFSYRSRTRAGRRAMQKWLIAHGCPKKTMEQLWFPEHKPAAHLSIDDRSYRFEGDRYPSPHWIAEFQAWWQIPAKVQAAKSASSGIQDCRRCGGQPEIG
jgi:hypothetical protein